MNSSDGEPDGDPGAGWRQVTQRHYDPAEDAELTTTVVFAIAEAAGISPTELRSPPLYEAVDLAAIEDAFFGRETRSGSRRGTGTVEFQYTDYLVRIGSDGWVSVAEAVT